ncbi:MAG: hypothetical protein JWL70_2512, partial [Acidimicrobiia bacterium]|nr:hypothetical protein [Acidimicrobiia bacterium]
AARSAMSAPPTAPPTPDAVLPSERFGEQDFVDYQPAALRSRRIVSIVVTLALLAVLSAGGVGLWAFRQVNPPGSPGPAVPVVVEQGMTVSELADRLQSEGVVGNATIFRWYADRKGLKLKPGTYAIPKRESMSAIVKVLSTSLAETYVKVTFPEGLTVPQMATLLAAKVPRMSAAAFLKVASSGQIVSTLAPPGTSSLEGLLFPDTYRIYGNWDEARVVKEMAAQMEQVAEAKESIIEEAPLIALNPTTSVTPYQVLIVASLIEREAKVPEDRAKIAAVIYNRLRKGVNLDIDATVLYAKPGEQNKVTQALIDETASSPYNTYKNGGKLPPTPIANPSRASIYAALHPADGKWIFYVLADAKTGRHVFAETYAEHLRNIAAAKKAGALPP